MEEHKSEIADWDLGAGIYIDFYTIKASLQEDDAMYDAVRDPTAYFTNMHIVNQHVRFFN